MLQVLNQIPGSNTIYSHQRIWDQHWPGSWSCSSRQQRSILAFSTRQSLSHWDSRQFSQSVSQLSVLLSLYSDDLAMITGSIPPAMWTAGWELHHYPHGRGVANTSPPPFPSLPRLWASQLLWHTSSYNLIKKSVTLSRSYGHKWEICGFYDL